MIKYNLEEFFEEIKSIEKAKEKSIVRIKVHGIAFTIKQLKEVHELENVNKDFWQNIELECKYFLSRREALIVILEEDFYNKQAYNFTDLTQYENNANVRFEIKNKAKKDLDTPQKVHPKNPCIYFNKDNMGSKKFQYTKALSIILLTPFYFFKVEIAIDTLTKTYEKMIANDC